MIEIRKTFDTFSLWLTVGSTERVLAGPFRTYSEAFAFVKSLTRDDFTAAYERRWKAAA